MAQTVRCCCTYRGTGREFRPCVHLKVHAKSTPAANWPAPELHVLERFVKIVQASSLEGPH